MAEQSVLPRPPVGGSEIWVKGRVRWDLVVERGDESCTRMCRRDSDKLGSDNRCRDRMNMNACQGVSRAGQPGGGHGPAEMLVNRLISYVQMTELHNNDM
jgi:hypothetical protein